MNTPQSPLSVWRHSYRARPRTSLVESASPRPAAGRRRASWIITPRRSKSHRSHRFGASGATLVASAPRRPSRGGQQSGDDPGRAAGGDRVRRQHGAGVGDATGRGTDSASPGSPDAVLNAYPARRARSARPSWLGPRPRAYRPATLRLRRERPPPPGCHGEVPPHMAELVIKCIN